MLVSKYTVISSHRILYQMLRHALYVQVRQNLDVDSRVEVKLPGTLESRLERVLHGAEVVRVGGREVLGQLERERKVPQAQRERLVVLPCCMQRSGQQEYSGAFCSELIN